MPKLTLLLLLKQIALPPTVNATDYPGTAIIHGDVTLKLKGHHNYNVMQTRIVNPFCTEYQLLQYQNICFSAK